MQTPSIFTFAATALLLGLGWVGMRSAQALQNTPAAVEKPAEVKSSDTPAGEKPPVESTPEDGAKADKLLAEGRSRLEDRQSLQADMKQQISVYDRKLTAEGKYISGAYPKLRLEYKIRVGTMQGSLVEVCDGQILHTQKTVGKVPEKGIPKGKEEQPDQQFTRRDVQRILAARDRSPNLAIANHGAELGVGGLPAILASIDRCMVGQRVTEEEFEGQMCQVFHGVWDQEILKKFRTTLQQGMPQLVPFFPDKVQVFFTAETVTPVKIVYLKDLQNDAGQVVAQQPLMVLELRNLKLDEAVPASTFQFVLPPKREEIDKTNDFLELIKQSDSAFKGQPTAAPPRR